MAGLMDLFTQKIEPGALFKDYSVDPKLAEQAAMAAMFAAPAGITAWHGSPYQFKAFDPTKIGSGEGAQAYGYGHYLAENPAVAKDYKRNLTASTATLDGKPLSSLSTLERDAADYATEYGGAQQAIDVLNSKIQFGSKFDDLDWLTKVRDKLLSSKYSKSEGALYKIDLPDEHIAKMLNWDQELGKQTPEIMKLAKQYGLAMDDLGGDLVAAMNAKQAAGAEAMRQAGVPGIKYFDAQSRGGKMADTQNFVVFPGNEGLLKMLEMNDKPMSFWGF